MQLDKGRLWMKQSDTSLLLLQILFRYLQIEGEKEIDYYILSNHLLVQSRARPPVYNVMEIMARRIRE